MSVDIDGTTYAGRPQVAIVPSLGGPTVTLVPKCTQDASFQIVSRMTDPPYLIESRPLVILISVEVPSQCHIQVLRHCVLSQIPPCLSLFFGCKTLTVALKLFSGFKVD